MSKNYGTEVQDLRAANKLSSDKILAGTKIWIPEGKPSPVRKAQSTQGSNDLYLLARLINGEARGESFTGQVAVGQSFSIGSNRVSFPTPSPGMFIRNYNSNQSLTGRFGSR